MSRSLLQVDRSAASSAPVYGPGLRVSQPGDAHEHEADKIADTVVRGGSVPRWQFSPTQGGAVQRDPTTDPPKPMSTVDMAGKVAEAVLATDAGKKAVKAIKGDPVVKAVKDFITTPAGIAVVGTTAVGTVSALAATKTPLPLQVPKIPLDMVVPGLAVKIEYKGPVNHPTSGMLTFSFTPGGGKKEKSKSESDSIAADIAQLRAEQAQMQAMMHPETLDTNSKLPGPRVAQPAADDKKKEDPPVQRKAESTAPVTANPQSVAAVTQSGGRPLDTATRISMERRMGFDFSKVHVHDDARAADSARELHANAYTTGTSIVFNAGRYSPSTTEGRHLLAHELAHVVQQSGGQGSLVQRQPAAAPAKDPNLALENDLRGMIAHATWPELRGKIYAQQSAPAIKRERQRIAGKIPDLTGAGRLPSLDTFATSMHGIQHRWSEDAKSTADDRVTWIGKAADDFLTGAAVPKLKDKKKKDMTPRGQFVPSEWKLNIQQHMVEQATLPDDAAADLANTTAHECRHAEQEFVAARYAAGFEKLDADAISTRQQLHKDIAEIAVTQKMTPKTDSAEKKLGATMAKTMGPDAQKNQATTDEATDAIDKLDPARQEAQAALTALEANANSATIAAAKAKRAKLRTQIETITRKYAGYRAIPDEADAHEVGDAEEIAFREWKP